MNKLKKNSLFHKIILIIISIFLGVSLITFNYFSIGRSAPVSGLDSSLKLSLDSSGDTEAKWSAKSRSINGEVKAEGDMCGDTAKNGTLTITYIGSEECELSFDYTIEKNDGKIEIDGSGINQNSSFIKKMNKNDSIKIYIESNSSSSVTSIDIANIKVGINKSITLTFLPCTNGTYTLNGESITEKRVFETKTNIEFTLLANANEGYKFAGWVFNDKTISTDIKFKSTYSGNATIKCIFINKDSPLFSNNNTTFYDLQDAINSANSNANNDNKIILLESGTIFNEENLPINYDFNGIDFVIPCSNTIMTDYNKPSFKNNDSASILYKKLSISDNIQLNFYSNSNIVVSTEYIKAAGGGQTGGGSPRGHYGQIELIGENSRIIMNNGSNLYAYGYLTGNGMVSAKYGSKIVELFQINDFRGGSITSNMGSRVFPFNQYYVQNIECKLQVEYGAKEIVKTALYAVRSVFDATFTFIDNVAFTGAALFKLAENSILSRYYDINLDRIYYKLNQGTADISSISLKVAGMSVDSKNYTLPITNNMELTLDSHSTVNINQELCFLPGSKINICAGATLNINSSYKIYLYDRNNWIGKNFGYHGNKSDIVYSPTKNYNRTDADLFDTTLDINGKLNISNNAGIFTTYDSNNYANVYTSNGTGTVNYNDAPITNENVTYQYNAGTKTEILIQQLALRNSKNEIESSTDTYLFLKDEQPLDNLIYYFDNIQNKWLKKDNTIKTYKITFIGPNNEITKEYTTDVDFTFPSSVDEDFKDFLYQSKYKVRKRKIEGIGIYDAGKTYKLATTSDLRASPIYGGWYLDIDNKSNYYLDYNSGELFKGLKKVESKDNTDNISICYFDETSGLFKDDYTNTYLNPTDNKYYFIINGVVQEKGFYKYSLDNTSNDYNYVFVNNDNSLLTNGTYYIDVSEINNSLLPSGYYTFDNNGLISKEDKTISNYNGDNVYIANINNEGDSTYINGIRVAYGLFIDNNHYKYSNTEGYIVKNTTYYVSNINNLNNIKEGLYYFDNNGFMYDENFNIIEVN